MACTLVHSFLSMASYTVCSMKGVRVKGDLNFLCTHFIDTNWDAPSEPSSINHLVHLFMGTVLDKILDLIVHCHQPIRAWSDCLPVPYPLNKECSSQGGYWSNDCNKSDIPFLVLSWTAPSEGVRWNLQLWVATQLSILTCMRLPHPSPP